MRARLCDSVSGRHRPEENSLLTKHVVAAGRFAWDAGSTPAASSLRSSAARTKTAAPEPAFEAKAGLCIVVQALELRLGKPVSEMDFSYVYILQSQSDIRRFYSGLTGDLKD